MNSNIVIVDTYNNIERINTIDREREQTQSMHAFQKWCKDMKIGSRIEVKDYNAIEMMREYDYSIKESRMPEFIRRWF